MASDTIQGDTVRGGLTDPVFGSQAVFRATMDAFAAPGTIVDFGRAVDAPPPLVPAAAALMATLADGDTPIWLADPTGPAARWLRFQTGAPLTEDPARATFALLAEGDGGFERFAIGTPDDPDRSATLLLPVRALTGGAPLRLTGPGIETERLIAPAGPPAGLLGVMAANRALFPRGFDLVLVHGTAALALPRTTRVREA